MDAPHHQTELLIGISSIFLRLVPLPLLDWWLEEHFHNRMVERIAEQRGRRLNPAVRQALTTSGRSLLAAWLLFLLKLPLRLILRLVHKLVYVLAIKEAAEKISFYWQRAFLIDHMLQAGHLEGVTSARCAQEAMQAAMHDFPSPLTALAKQVARRIWQMPHSARVPRWPGLQRLTPSSAALSGVSGPSMRAF